MENCHYAVDQAMNHPGVGTSATLGRHSLDLAAAGVCQAYGHTGHYGFLRHRCDTRAVDVEGACYRLCEGIS